MSVSGREIAKAKYGEGLTWEETAKQFGLSPAAARSRARRCPSYNRIKEGAPEPEVSGIRAEQKIDSDKTLERAIEEWKCSEQRRKKQDQQKISFERGPVALTWIADLHLGGPGVNYPRVFEEAELIANTPGMYVGVLGDLVDQFIISKLSHKYLRRHLSIPDEWVLLKKYLETLGNKLQVVVRGNHEGWMQALTGLDYFREAVEDVSPDVLYDRHDCSFKLEVGDDAWRVRARHKWKGSSIYNPTHGIERAAKWDQDFDIGVGAHTHQGSFARGFDRGGEAAMALMCGSYKVEDEYASKQGFSHARQSTAVTVIARDGKLLGCEYISLASEIMHNFYV